LIVFPAAAVNRGVRVLLGLKESVDDLMVQREWECRLTAKAHYGLGRDLHARFKQDTPITYIRDQDLTERATTGTPA
jgi:hypothetical protein